MQDFAIIGAGLCGLNLAWDLIKHFPAAQIEVLEKSKSCGGRIATRRINDGKFDHGAQFINNTKDVTDLISFWESKNVLQKFPSTTRDGFCGRSGLTQLAKAIAQDVNITYNHKVVQIQQEENHWILHDENQIQKQAKNIILTSPLPQALELLYHSGIDFNPNLNQIHYANAIVVLIESEGTHETSMVYEEKISPRIFSICAQHLKGNSETPAYTVVMTPEWSNTYFDSFDVYILEKACAVIKEERPDLKIKSAHLKKWRYSHPLSTWPRLYENPVPGIFLAGDAFGGPSLVGTLRSSQALFAYLKHQ